MDAHAEGHLVLAELEVGVANLGDDAGREGEADGADVLAGLLGGGDDLVQGAHLVGLGARRLVHEVDAGHAAARLDVGVGKNVVGAHERLRFDVVHVEQLGRHVEVHDVAGVVAVEEQHARAGLDLLGDVVDLLGRRGLENAADAAAVEQALADVAEEEGQVTGAAAGDDGDLAVLLPGGAVAAQVVRGGLDLLGEGGVDALEHLVGVGLGGVDDLLHWVAFLKGR